MQRINGMNEMNNSPIDLDTIEIKQFTTVYHSELGKGSVVSVTYRKDNNLIMCYFPNGRTHDWATERELRSGVGDITLTRHAPTAMRDNVGDSLEDALRSLFNPR